MRIHINRSGNALGVFSLDDLNREIAAGRLLPSDLAWYEGAAGWIPAAQVPGVVLPERTVWTPPTAKLTEHDETHSPNELGYAGFWKRVAAKVLDGFILLLLILPLSMMLGAIIGRANGSVAGAELVGNFIGIIGSFLYFTIQHSSSHQATLGKRALGIIVTDLDGRRISFAHAAGRHVASILNYVTLYIGWMMAGFTERKQGLHDLVARTLVLNREPDAKGVPAWAIVLIVVVIGGTFFVGILAAIAIPAYADYTKRAQVTEAVNEAGDAKVAIAEYYAEHEALPHSLETAGYTGSASSKQISMMTIDDGVLMLNLRNGNAVGLEPYRKASGIVWRCGNAGTPPGAQDIAGGDSADLTTVPASELPIACRPARR